MKITSQHLSTHEIGAYVHRRLRPEALLRIANHLPACTECCEAVANEMTVLSSPPCAEELHEVGAELLSTGTHG